MINKALIKAFLILMAILWAILALFGEEPARPSPADAPPSIDGRLDDPAWQSALVFRDFKTAKPDFGKPPTEKTEFLFAYDAKHLYFGFRCFDSAPAGIKATLAKRDGASGDDSVCLILDMFNDQQNGYAFFVNPRGVQMDGMVGPDSQCDVSVDLIWASQGVIDDSGYTVEMAVPLKSLRYPARRTLTVGIMAFRFISRRSEEDYSPEFSFSRGSMLSQLRKVEISGIAQERTVEGIPALTFSHGRERKAGLWAPHVRQTDLSLTGKVGLTSDLTIDAAYNPDFSQVESDAGQVDINLRNSLYYPEKRPFFLEGLEDFTFAGSVEQNPLISVVHTRRIVDPKLGFKLTGKAGSRNQISAIFALDEYPGSAAEAGPTDVTGADAPFTIVRCKRLMSRDAYLGAFFTRRSFDGSSNTLGGLDGRFRLNNTMLLEGFAFNTWTRSVRNGRRMRGEALGLKFAYLTRRNSVYIGAYDIAPEFRTDTGFITRTGVRMLSGFASVRFYPRSKVFQRIDPYYYFSQIHDVPSGLFESQNYFALRFLMPRQTMIRLMASISNEVYAGRRFRKDGWWITASSQVTNEVSLQLNLMDTKAILYDPAAPVQGQSLRLTAGLRYQPMERLSTEGDLTYANFYRDADGVKVYDYTILRSKTTFQVNKYLFFRGILEYNAFRKRLTADILASFAYIPGTVLFVGYGSAFERVRWDSDGGLYRPADEFWPTQRTFFFKASYLWRF